MAFINHEGSLRQDPALFKITEIANIANFLQMLVDRDFIIAQSRLAGSPILFLRNAFIYFLLSKFFFNFEIGLIKIFNNIIFKGWFYEKYWQ